MGETDKDVKDEPQDAGDLPLTSEVPSDVEEGSTSKPPQTFTPEDVQKQVSDALAKAGRDAKALEARKAALDESEKKVKAWEAERVKEAKAREDAILEEATEGQPEKVKTDLKTFKERLRNERQQLDKDRAAFEEEKTQYSGKIKEADAIQFELSVYDVASRNNVSADVLKERAEKFKVTDEAGLDELAQILPKKGKAAEKVDSGKNEGGGGKLTAEQLENLSEPELKKYLASHRK